VLYYAGGCISCHKAEAGLGGTGAPTGEAKFETPVGTFWPGNLTPDPETGLGSWTAEQFVDAMTRGVSPDRRHYFPAFPTKPGIGERTWSTDLGTVVNATPLAMP
jgi:hypothetical protein